MATPARRSMRNSPRTSSPATRRATRASPAARATESDRTENTGDGEENKQPPHGLARLPDGQEAELTDHGMNGLTTPSGPARARDRTRGKLLKVSSSVAEQTGSRSSSRQRKPARIVEMIKQEEKDAQGGQHAVGDDAVDVATGAPTRLEESGDDDYTPAAKSGKGRASRKSRESKSQDSISDGLIENLDYHTIEGRQKLQEIADAAVYKCIERGNELLGVVLRRIHERTFTDDQLASTFTACLSAEPPPHEVAVFRAVVKEERRIARRELDRGLLNIETALAPEASRNKSTRTSESKSASPSKSSSPRKPAASIATPSEPPVKATRQSNPVHSRISTSSVSTPSKMAVVTRRSAKRQQEQEESASPVPTSPKKLEPPSVTISAGPPAASTRNSKKRPSSTPEPKVTQNGASAGHPTEGEPPRKKTKLSKENQSSSSSALSELSTSSRETSTEPRSTAANGLLATGSFSSAITTGVKIGGDLKKKPEPAQKAKILANPDGGLGLPDDQMEITRRKLTRNNFPGYAVQESSIRDAVKPAAKRPAPSPIDVYGVYSDEIRYQLEHNNPASPASSSVQGDPLIPPPPGAAKPSRSGTPAAGGRRTARIKISPVKKKIGPAGGQGARAGGRDSPAAFNADEDSDNVDYCIACNESGELLCCDGCPRSFHFSCCDPPFEQDQPPTGEWYCHVCEYKRNPVPRPPRGLFAMLMHDMSRQNPSTFRLPKSIRTYFEGVKEGESGEYADEAGVPKHKTRATGPTAEVEADSFKIKDAKGNFVLCAHCGKTAGGKREMIKCDYCSLHWHLDCLNPPPANPPVRSFGNRSRPQWKCPAHAELDTTLPGVHKMRRPANAKIVDTMLNRGHKNNGDIEIELDSSDEESETEVNEDGTVFRVTEKSIKLDFIDRIKRMAEEEERKHRWERELSQARHEAHQEVIGWHNARWAAEAEALEALRLMKNGPQPQSSEQSGLSVAAPHRDRVGRASGVAAFDRGQKQRLQSFISDLMDEISPEVAGLVEEATDTNALNGAFADLSTPNSSPSVKAQYAGIKKAKRSSKSKLGQKDRHALHMLQELISKRLEAESDDEFTADNKMAGDEDANGVE